MKAARGDGIGQLRAHLLESGHFFFQRGKIPLHFWAIDGRVEICQAPSFLRKDFF